MFTTIGLAGCSNSCLWSLNNNGNNGAIIVPLNPSPVCSLTKANGTMQAVALKSAVCETCTAAARVEHVFVTVRSIELRASPIVDTNATDWLEIAPQLANEPRQIDLIGNSMPEILVESAIVPAGSYREVRLQFFHESPTNAEKFSAENACGETGWNCIVMADGYVDPLHLPGDLPELLIPIQNGESDSFAVLPDAKMNLRLSLEAHQLFHLSSTEGWNPRMVLEGYATVVRRWSSVPEDATSN